MTIPTLAKLTTFHVGDPIRGYFAIDGRAALINTIKKADEAGTPLFMIGGGSNLLACDEGFGGLVVRDLRSGIYIEQTPASARAQAEPHDPEGPRRAARHVTTGIGTAWDKFVDWSLSEGLSGSEALSETPETAGTAPVQSIGAYSCELGETLLEVRVWDRRKKQEAALGTEGLAFGYRESIIKHSIHTGDKDEGLWGPSGRWVVLEVTSLLKVFPLSFPALYRELARRLDIEQGGRVEARIVRDTVLAFCRTKGMVLDPEDHDSWSAGPFFVNPILSPQTAEFLPVGVPRFPATDGRAKTPAAWLINHAGPPKGCSIPGAREGGVALSGKRVLTLTDQGQANAVEVVGLAPRVQKGVEKRLGVHLIPEPFVLGIA